MAYRYSNTPKIDDLSDAELLAHFFVNSAKYPALDKARDLINEAGSLSAVVTGSTKGKRYLKVNESRRLLSGLEISKRIAFQSLHSADVLSSPAEVRTFLSLQLGAREHEVFCGLFLDNRHRVIEFRELFRGTIDSAAVYPREVVKTCLSCNAAAVIFAHNHPSKVAEPSDTDVRLTRKLVDALALIDVRVLDHLIVGGDTQTSLAERGLM